MAYKPVHYYQDTVPKVYRCGGSGSGDNALLERIKTLEAKLDALEQGGGSNPTLETRVAKLENEVVKRSDLVQETHQSFDPNEDIIHTLRFKGV